MADNTKIEWTDSTWQIITGCSVVSAGCKHCYAMKLAGTRLRNHPSRAGLTIDTAAGPVWNGQVRFNEQWLDQPLRWRRPRRIFVCAHGDLFHESVPFAWIAMVFGVMNAARHHTFQVLTKRPARAIEFFDWLATQTQHHAQWVSEVAEAERLCGEIPGSRGAKNHPPQCVAVHAHIDAALKKLPIGMYVNWPLPNVWIGVSVENQDAADERIPMLLKMPAAVRWISAEPLLGPVDIFPYLAANDLHRIDGGPRIDWVVTGGESGLGARPLHPSIPRSLRDQCAEAGIAFTHKQNGAWLHESQVTKDTPIVISDKTVTDWPDGTASYLVGKKAAGRLLDGVLHDAFPEVRHG